MMSCLCIPLNITESTANAGGLQPVLPAENSFGSLGKKQLLQVCSTVVVVIVPQWLPDENLPEAAAAALSEHAANGGRGNAPDRAGARMPGRTNWSAKRQFPSLKNLLILSRKYKTKAVSK